MKLVSWRSPRALAAYGMFVAVPVLFLSLPTTARTESACDVLREWARPYASATPTLDEFSQFDRAHRIAIFNAVAPAVRASLVQDHLRRFSQRPDLSSTQRAAIAEAITLATPALYEHQPGATQAARQFWSRTEGMFTSPVQRRPWFNLGGSVTVMEAPIPGALNVSGMLPRGTLAGSFCECSTFWQDCGGGLYCVGSGCTTGYFGCGPMWNDLCDALCR